MVLELFEAPCVPSDTLPVGEVIASAPAVRVKVAGVTAPAGRAVAAASAANVLVRSRNFRIVRGPFLLETRRPDCNLKRAEKQPYWPIGVDQPLCGSPIRRDGSPRKPGCAC